MLGFGDLTSSQPGIRISLKMPIDQALEMMTDALEDIMRCSGWAPGMPAYKHYAIVSGLTSSCRILSDRPFNTSVPMHVPLTPNGLALDFLTKFCFKARFSSKPPGDDSSWSKCYEVRSVRMNGHPAALVLAGWMQDQ